MLPIISHRKVYLSISVILVLLSYAAIWRWGLKLGIDYTNGSLSEIQYLGNEALEPADIQKKLIAEGFGVSSIQPSQDNTFFIRMKPLDEQDHQRYLDTLEAAYMQKGSGAGLQESVSTEPLSTSTTDSSVQTSSTVGVQKIWYERNFDSIGPSISAELRKKSYWAIASALAAIVLFIAYSFRKVSKPVASWKFGICAIVALMHDISISTGFMAYMGHARGWEVDLMFITALLTILGFSVHDTIVVFDRIRENLLKSGSRNFEEITNISINQTIARSINTSLTTIIVLLALFLFGGDSTRHFTLILVIGIFVGTYSSIFIASPLLVIWSRFAYKMK